MSGLPPVDEAVQVDARCASAAVVMGFEDYDALPTVAWAARDAAAFASFVEHTLGCPAPTVLGPGTDRAAVLAALTAAGKAPGAHTVWVYFAGNAATVTRPTLLLPDTPADPSQFEAHGVALTEVRTLARAGGADLLLLVDAGFDGRSRSGAELVPGHRFTLPNASAVDPGSIDWFAATPGEVAGPLDVARHGAFTWAVLGALRGWGDGFHDRADTRVSADEADRFTRETLQDLGVDQHPVLRGDRLRTLSLAHEAVPSLDPLAWAPEPAPAAVDSPERGTLVVTVPVELTVFVDGAEQVARDHVATAVVRPGRHLVEIRTPTGTPVTGLTVDVAADGSVALTYRDRQLFVR